MVEKARFNCNERGSIVGDADGYCERVGDRVVGFAEGDGLGLGLSVGTTDGAELLALGDGVGWGLSVGRKEGA